MSDRPFYGAAWNKRKEKGTTIYTRPCRICQGEYVFGFGCRSQACATGTIIKSICFVMAKKLFFRKKFCKLHVFLPHHPFCIDGVSADKACYGDVMKKAQVDPMAKPPQKPEQPKAEPISKKKRKYTDESCFFESSTSLWLPRGHILELNVAMFLVDHFARKRPRRVLRRKVIKHCHKRPPK